MGQIYAGLACIRDNYAKLVREKFPRIPRRVSGYNLDELLPENTFNVARALVGSEGTCANIVSATLNLTASPPYRVLTVLGFADPFLAADAVPLALEHGPIGLEGFDHLLVDFMRRKGLALRDLAQLPSGVSFLLVELGAWTAEEVRDKAETIGSRMPDLALPSRRPHLYAKKQHQYLASARFRAWRNGLRSRRARSPRGLGRCSRSAREARQLPARHHGLMAEYGFRSPLYGHYGQGCVHTRINFDFHSEGGLRRFREFIRRAADVVLSFGGSLSGEHGDGQSRAALLPKMFGPELMEAFKRVQGPLRSRQSHESRQAHRCGPRLRSYGEPPPCSGCQCSGASLTCRRVSIPRSRDPLRVCKRQGSLERATERCVGVGSCRNTQGGVMCPSYRATGEEQHSTRGRAHLLWEMLAGALRHEGFQSEAVHEALDLCLSCKACKSECPVQVDMAAYKSEFLAQHYKGRLHPLHHYIFGFADRLARYGSLAPSLTNALLTGPLTSPLVKRIAGVARQRHLPRLAAKSFQKTQNTSSGFERSVLEAAPPQVVLLWPDTWNNYYHPQTLAAAEAVLTQAGFRVEVPKGHICCGRPLYDFGFLSAARTYLSRVLSRMAPQIEAGMPFIFLEPSCASVFKDELLELFPNDPRAIRMSRQVWLLADWLAAYAPDSFSARLKGARILVHGHCHHKAVFGGPANEIALLRKTGATVEAIQAGCCGMAGPFGFEADKFDVSRTIANQELLPAVQSAGPTTIVVADGFSCREQIDQLGHVRALHFAEVLARTCGCGS